MKILYSFLFSWSIFTISNVNAQGISYDAKSSLEGKWIANCATEFQDKATIKHCEICQFVVDKNDSSRATLEDIDMEFSGDSLAISTNGHYEKVHYDFDSNKNTINFPYNKIEHSFRILYSVKQVILEDNEGSALLLTRTDQ